MESYSPTPCTSQATGPAVDHTHVRPGRDEPASRAVWRWNLQEQHAEVHCCILMGMTTGQSARTIAAASQQSRAHAHVLTRVERAMDASTGWPLRCRMGPSTGTGTAFCALPFDIRYCAYIPHLAVCGYHKVNVEQSKCLPSSAAMWVRGLPHAALDGSNTCRQHTTSVAYGIQVPAVSRSWPETN